MNYRIEDILPEGLLVQGERDEDWLKGLFQDLKGLEFTFASPITYSIRLSRSGSHIMVTGAINVKVELPCSRCLEKYVFSINSDFTFFLSPANFKNLPLEMELQKEELNMEFYEGEVKVIDLSRIIQNQIILSIPFNPICKEGCKGLCPHCGINRNQETCECSDEGPFDPRLAVLKNFFKPNKT
ncbi:MAG: DUF177 domain-containing protein [Pseudomonadota bacterium]